MSSSPAENALVPLERVVVINDEAIASGGAAVLALLSARLLREAGIPVTFLSGDAGSNPALSSDGIEVSGIGSAPLLKLPLHRRIVEGAYNRLAHRRIREYIAQHDTPGTIYHVHAWAQILSPSIFSALRPVHHRLVISAHDFTLVCPNGSYANFNQSTVCELTPLSRQCLASHCDKRRYADKVWRFGRSWLRTRLLQLADSECTIASIHPLMNPWLERGGIPQERIRTVLNPVRPFARRRIPAETNDDIFIIGRVEFEKGVDIAAEAARRVNRKLRVIGDGAFREELLQRYPEIVWEGWRSHEEIAELLQQARFVVMPSRLPEPFGLVAHESLQSGVPVVAFKSAFIAQEARQLGCGIVAERTDVDSLAAAFAKMDDDATVERMSHLAFDVSPRLSNTPGSWRDEFIALYKSRLRSQEQAVLRPGPELSYGRAQAV
ncbi:glycosyltransferase family 4 protein [Phyllobacterium sp. 21LDTY02-6]|jgi:glycosyltransferase involved in cell wall biosynthesis|uniref:glycosyltransferase family 4 protein n=1 Tax=unclassified Phyllobacterium TaxID=2638441 RepID=UPI0020213753|nr:MULTISPECIES: glycosyltransferase family 4 protein [unclassified Phyllobacterium]MCO4319287.1 glycosyltransferase family 4 protein [Phyllobacterium sp. 21LDTY02-6]MCX8279950.1 glycosyltransferase family 4 protein [Phyllobacterium sp. 0TCS1.6C]MCX8296117.1 glycosyltransferase family 4 protein [Phyllobacterium sp. 0TCS1.6A]